MIPYFPSSGILRKYFYSNDINELKKYIDYIDPNLSLSDYVWGLKEGYYESISLLIEHDRFLPDHIFVTNNMALIPPQLLIIILKAVKFSKYILDHFMTSFCDNLMFELANILHKHYDIKYPRNFGLMVAKTKNQDYIYNLYRIGYVISDNELIEIKSSGLIDEYRIFVNYRCRSEYLKYHSHNSYANNLFVVDDIIKNYPDVSLDTKIVFRQPIKDMIELIIKSFNFNILSSICKTDLSGEIKYMITKNTWGSYADTCFQYLLLLINNTTKFNRECLITEWGRLINPMHIIDWHEHVDSIKCYNIEDTKLAINKETFLGKDFNECLNETSVLINIDDYILDINELFAYWVERINSYNRIIMPHYPDHPYTRKPMSGNMLFNVFNIAISKKINIPNILRIFIFRPKILRIIETIEDEYQRIEILRGNLFSLKFKYDGGDPENNDPGEWSYGSLFCPEREFYHDSFDNSLILTMCYIRYINIKN
jgi:hypothetical protein